MQNWRMPLMPHKTAAAETESDGKKTVHHWMASRLLKLTLLYLYL